MSHIIYIWSCFLFGPLYSIITLTIGIIWFNLAYSLYTHRIVSHNHFIISDAYHKILGFMFCCLNFGSPAMFSAVHANHHIFYGTEKDPHDPKRIGQLRASLKLWDEKYTPNKKIFKKLLDHPILRWQHDTHYIIAVFSTFILPFIQVTGFWLSNILIIYAHMGELPDDSKNLHILKFLLWGEELHKNHHLDQNLKNHNTNNTLAEYDFIYYLGRKISKI